MSATPRPRRNTKATAKANASKRTRDDDDIALGQDDASGAGEPAKTPRLSGSDSLTPGVVEVPVATADTFTDPFALITDQTTTSGVIFGAPPVQSNEPNDPRDPREVFSRPGAARTLDTEEVVRRQLAILAPDATQEARTLADTTNGKQQFVLRGLSRLVDNPKYAEQTEQRRRFDDQRKYILRQRDLYDRLFYNNERVNPGFMREFDSERIAFLMQSFRPPQALVLLIPGAQKGFLTNYWRRELGSVGSELLSTYQSKNTDAEPGLGTRFLAGDLVAYHARPIVLRRLEELRNSEYHDMPVTIELLEHYFREYITAAYNRLIVLATDPAAAAGAVAEMTLPLAEDEQQSNDLTSLSRAFTTTYEAAPQLLYYASVLTLHASRNYRSYFDDWKLKQNFSAATEAAQLHKQTIAKLDEFINTMIRTYDRYQSQSSGEKYFHANRPLSIADYKEQYRRMLFLEVAQHRADNLYTHSGLQSLLMAYLTAREGVEFDNRLLLDVPLQFGAILDAARTEALGYVANADVVQRGVIASRYDVALTALRKIWPGYPDSQRSAHGPIDQPTTHVPPPPSFAAPDAVPPPPVVADRWSPYDLSYPLDIARTEAAKDDIQIELIALLPMFDPVRTADEAMRRRDALGVLYANRRLAIELSQAEYLLNKVLSPQVEVPLVVDRMVYDSNELALEARLELSPQLLSRIAYVPRDNILGVDAEAKAALEKLQTAEFDIAWFHRPTHGGAERLIATARLTNANSARLVIIAAGSDLETVGAILNVAGQYRAAVTQRDNGAVYSSVYVATVNVYAQCLRDGKKFVPTFGAGALRTHGQCIWRPIPADDQYIDRMIALKTLVTRGVGEYLAYVRAPRNDAETAGEPCLPPWGSSSPMNLRRIALMSDDEINSMFTFQHMIGAFIDRFAINIRQMLTEDAPVLPANNMQLFVRTVQQYTNVFSAENTTASAIAVPSSLDKPVTKSIYDLRVLAETIQSMRPADADDRQTSSGDFGTVVSDAPVVGLLNLLRAPFAVVFQTGRERRFIAKLVADYATFKQLYLYRVAAREKIEVNEHAGNFSANALRYLKERFEIDVETLRPDDVYRTAILEGLQMRDLFIDTSSRTELKGRIESLPRSLIERYRPPIDIGSAGDQNMWKGVHSFVSALPDLLVVGKTREELPSTGLPLSLVVVQRGSEPLDRGYDFDTLYRLVDQTVHAYNQRTRSNIPSEDLYYEVGRRVTIYNYFAFLAPAQPRGSFVTAETLEQRIQTGAYQHLAMFVPTPIDEIN